jgi:hypothetical protein
MTPGMDESTPAKKSCPECGGSQYQFRSRKKVAGDQGGAVETKGSELALWPTAACRGVQGRRLLHPLE